MNKTFFAPQLYIPSGVHDISFYTKAFDATELRRWTNDDGSIHVAEFAIDDLIFHLHEANRQKGFFEPLAIAGITATIGLFVPDVDAVMQNAVKAGATETS